MTDVTEGAGIFAGNRKRSMSSRLEFGAMGELTPTTIEQANLTPQERERAFEMMEVQNAYLQILDCLSYPVDPEGHVHDLNMMTPTRIAIAWTLALAGARMSGTPFIKKRYFSSPGCYANAHTWVDIRQPDTAEEALKPTDKADDPNLPPDTRRLAALRDGEPPMDMPQTWQNTPKLTTSFVPRDKT